MFIQLHKPKSTGEIISLERRLYDVVQKEWDSQEPTGHSFALQTQKDVSTICNSISSGQYEAISELFCASVSKRVLV